MRKFLLLVALMCLFSPVASAQLSQRIGMVISGSGRPVPGASIYVCSGNVTPNFGTTPPCTLASIFSDVAGDDPITQPVQTDGLGNYWWYAASGTYTEATTSIGINGYSQVVTLGGAGGGGSPGGSNLAVQYYCAATVAFCGDTTNFYYNPTSTTLNVPNIIASTLVQSNGTMFSSGTIQSSTDVIAGYLGSLSTPLASAGAIRLNGSTDLACWFDDSSHNDCLSIFNSTGYPEWTVSYGASPTSYYIPLFTGTWTSGDCLIESATQPIVNSGTCGSGGTSSWNGITNPTANQSLTMGSFTTQWAWTGGQAWSWNNQGNLEGFQTSLTAIAYSPSITLQGVYEATSGPTYNTDGWVCQDVIGTGVNGTSTLSCTHAGSSGAAAASFPNVTTGNVTASGAVSAATMTASTSISDAGLSQYGISYSSTSGGLVASIVAPTGAGSYVPGWVNSCSGGATAPVVIQFGMNTRTLASSDTIACTDNGGEENVPASGPTGNYALTMPAPSALGNGAFYTLVINRNSTYSEVVTSSGGYTIAGASTFTIPPDSESFISIDPTTSSNWSATLSMISLAAGGDLCNSFPDPTVCKVNGASIPASTPLLGSNSSSQLVAASALSVATVLECSDTSGSGTAQNCTTSPSLTVASGTLVRYTTTTANTGTGLTVNVDSLGAKSVAIPGTSGYTTTLTAGIIPANTWLDMIYSGTNWNVVQTGTASSGGGGGSGTVSNCSTQYALAYYAVTGTTVVCTTSLVSDANGDLTITNTSTSSVPLTVNAITGQTGDLEDWKVNGSTKFSVLSGGSALTGGNYECTASCFLDSTSPTATITIGGGSDGTSSNLGNVSLLGETNSSTGAAGSAFVAGGQNTSTGKQGFTQVQVPAIINTALTVAHELVCPTSTKYVYAACTTSQTDWAGESEATGTGSVDIVVAGTATVVFDGTPTVGDFVCVGTTTAGYAHDNGSTTDCVGPARVGYVNGDVSGSGSGATATVLFARGGLPGTGTQYGITDWATSTTLGTVGPASGYAGVAQSLSCITGDACTIGPEGVGVDTQSGSTYTIALTDRLGLVNLTNDTTSTAVTVPQSGSTNFDQYFGFAAINSGTVVATLTPTTSNVNGNTTLKIPAYIGSGYQPAGVLFYGDNENYHAFEISQKDSNGLIPNPDLTNSSVTVATDAPLSGGGTVSLGSSITLTVTCAAGEVMAGATPACTATPTLGASGTLGSMTMGNATSGTVTLEPVTGALGTVTASLPANTGTIAELNLAQTFSAAQTISATNGLTLSAMTGTACLEEVSGVVTSTGSACGSGGGGVTSLTGDGNIITNSASTGAVTLTIAGTSGGIPYFSSTSAWKSSALLAANALVVGGGSATAPLTGDADFTYSTHTLSSDASGIVNLGSITSTAGLVVPSAASETATAAGVIDFDTTNKNFHGYVDGADSIFANFASAPTNNVLPKASISSGNTLLTNSLLTDNATTLTYTGTGGVDSPVFTATGTTAGFIDYPEGSTSSSVAPCNATTSICVQAPTTVTSYLVDLPGAASSGVRLDVNASNVITEAHSGDSSHALDETSKTAAITTTTLCAATAGTACGQTGQYRISYNFWGSGTACSSVTAGSVGLNLTWTDENGTSHSTITMPMAFDQKAGAASTTFAFNTALGTEGAAGSYVISTNGTVIQFATTYTACTTGTGTYNLRLAVEQLQ